MVALFYIDLAGHKLCLPESPFLCSSRFSWATRDVLHENWKGREFSTFLPYSEGWGRARYRHRHRSGTGAAHAVPFICWLTCEWGHKHATTPPDSSRCPPAVSLACSEASRFVLKGATGLAGQPPHWSRRLGSSARPVWVPVHVWGLRPILAVPVCAYSPLLPIPLSS